MIDPARCSCACPSDKPYTIARPTPELGDMCSECTALNRIKLRGAPGPDGCCPIGSYILKVASDFVMEDECRTCMSGGVPKQCPSGQSFLNGSCACCPTDRLTSRGCCNKAILKRGDYCCNAGYDLAKVNNRSRCCLTTLITAGGICCAADKITTNKTCCEGATPYLINDACNACNAAGRTTQPGSLESDGCCPDAKPYTVKGVCSYCNASNRTKIAGAPVPDGCCPNGATVINGQCACPTSSPFIVDNKCSPCDALNRTKKAGAPVPDGCCANGATVINGLCTCPPSSPFIVDNKCSACNALNRTQRTGAPVPDGCCPDGETVINGQCTFACRLAITNSGSADFSSTLTATINTPQCLKDLVNEGLANCAAVTDSDHKDNCVAQLLWDQDFAFNYFRPSGKIAYVYFDSSCNRVAHAESPTANPPVCDIGSYTFGNSPVALLWEPSFRVEDLAKNVPLVSFPIDPKHADKLVEWKASSAAPLLVYDPSGEGKITSGYQLFGNWTFGPTKVASLAHSTVTNANGDKLWENGFEALAQLDSDANGEVSADELEPLSLWFDDNRNGISENGEVRRLSAVGVRKLFYRGYEGNDAAHAIVLKVGFERERNGVLERGTMVDWFTESVSSELEYAQRALLSSVVKPVADLKIASLIPSGDIKPKTSRVIAGEVLDGRSESLALKKGAELARGVWKWSSKSKDIPVDGGFFVISDNQDGTIQGLTMIELPIDSSFGASSIASVVGFKGTAKLEDSGKVSINFELNKEAGTDLQSSAELNGAGDSMNGSSHGTIKREAANTEITYSWSADKLK